ncbi:MAG TPA: hypothetical protein VFV94_16090 [Polyangiaceae bacterium]|jgi:hypothetical protein|nr:hypothetical protein [Polyangiaceae bacterium]
MMASVVARAALLLALPLAGCAVSAGAPSTGDRAVNRCETDADCAGDGVCSEQVCAAPTGALSSVLVSVSPTFAAGTYYFDYPAADDADGNPDDISVPALVNLAGSISIDTKPCEPTFIPADGTSIGLSDPDHNPDTREGLLPAQVTFMPTARAAGLPGDVYQAVVDRNGYTFTANLPPGDYDIYIRPYKQPIDDVTGDTKCAVPPRLLLKQAVTGSLDFKLKLASELNVQVVWAKDVSAAGWIVDLIDPSRGYPISSPRVLRPEDIISTGTHDATYQIKLDYVPTYGPDEDGVLQPLSIGNDVIRIRPPEVPPGYPPPVAPTLLAQLTGAELGNDASVKKPAVVRQSNPVPDKVTLEIATEIASVHKPTPANVVLTATKLPGFSEVSTSFTRTATTDATGSATVDLLPGTYRVVATPAAPCDDTSCFGTTETTWTIGASSAEQGGRLLEFLRASTIGGHAVVPSGGPAVGALVRAIASPSIVDSNVMNQGDALAPTLPRATFNQVDAGGDFLLRMDAGTYSFRVEPDPTTGFGWYVNPKVTVGGTNDTYLDVRLPLPVIHRGTVSSGTGDSRVTLPSALIRAYAYLAPDGTITPTPTQDSIAVQVAETHSDGAGNFSLLLPSSLADQ